MELDRSNLENADILAATGVSATTIQTWANRGILALSEAQRNPGPGQKRMYSRMDAARIAATKSLIERGLSASAAGQIAFRLERSPQTAASWRSAVEQIAGHIHLFIDGTDVVHIYVGNDVGELARLFTTINEPSEAGTIGRGIQESSPAQINAAVFDIGPVVSNALREIAARRRYDLSFSSISLGGDDTGPVTIQVLASPSPGSTGKHWRGVFTLDDLLSALARTLALPILQLNALRTGLSSLPSGRLMQLGGVTGLSALAVQEDSMTGLGLVEDMSLEEAVKIVKGRYGLLKSYIAASGMMLYVVGAEAQLRAIPGVSLPEYGIAILAPEVIELARGAITIEGLVRRKNPELFTKG